MSCNLPQKLIRLLLELGVLSGDLIFEQSLLIKIEKIYRSEKFIKIALARLSHKDRQRLADTCQLNRFESHVHTRAYCEKPPSVSELLAEVEAIFKIKPTAQIKERIKTIRKRSINKFSYMLKKYDEAGAGKVRSDTTGKGKQ